MLGLAQSTVALFHTHHLLAISQQVEHTMSFTHQFLATLIKHLVLLLSTWLQPQQR